MTIFPPSAQGIFPCVLRAERDDLPARIVSIRKRLRSRGEPWAGGRSGVGQIEIGEHLFADPGQRGKQWLRLLSRQPPWQDRQRHPDGWSHTSRRQLERDVDTRIRRKQLPKTDLWPSFKSTASRARFKRSHYGARGSCYAAERCALFASQTLCCAHCSLPAAALHRTRHFTSSTERVEITGAPYF